MIYSYHHHLVLECSRTASRPTYLGYKYYYPVPVWRLTVYEYVYPFVSKGCWVWCWHDLRLAKCISIDLDFDLDIIGATILEPRERKLHSRQCRAKRGLGPVCIMTRPKSILSHPINHKWAMISSRDDTTGLKDWRRRPISISISISIRLGLILRPLPPFSIILLVKLWEGKIMLGDVMERIFAFGTRYIPAMVGKRIACTDSSTPIKYPWQEVQDRRKRREGELSWDHSRMHFSDDDPNNID